MLSSYSIRIFLFSQYCLIETNGNVRNFQKPTLQDVMKHRIIVVTLSISMELANLGLPKGMFLFIYLKAYIFYNINAIG